MSLRSPCGRRPKVPALSEGICVVRPRRSLAPFAPNLRLRQNAMMPSETQLPQVKGSSTQNLIFLLLCGGFVVNGIIITFIGPILPIFIAKWKLDDSHAGMFFIAQFVGSFVGVLASSALISARGFKPALTIGLPIRGIALPLRRPPPSFPPPCPSPFFAV